MEFRSRRGLNEVKRELDGAEETGAHQLLGHLQIMAGNPQVPNLAGFPGPQRPFQAPCLRGQGLKILLLRNLVQLKQIEVIGLQESQALLQISLQPQPVPLDTLGGQDHLRPQALKGPPDLLFAVQIDIGGVEQGDAPFLGPAQHPDGFVHAQADDRDAAEPNLGNLQSRFP